MKLHPPGDVDPIKSTIKVSKPTLVYGDVEGAIVTITLLDKDGNAPDAYRMARTTIKLTIDAVGAQVTKLPMRDGLDPVNVFKTVITPLNDDVRVVVMATAVRKADCNGNDANTVELSKKPSGKSIISLDPSASDDSNRNFKTTVTFTALDASGKVIPVDISKHLTIVAKDNYKTGADANTILKITAKDVNMGQYTAIFNTTTMSEFAILVEYKGDAIEAVGDTKFETWIPISSANSAMEVIGSDTTDGRNFTIKGKKAGDTINLMLTLKDFTGKLVEGILFNNYTAEFKVNSHDAELNFKSNNDGTYSGTYTLPTDAKPGSKYQFKSLFFEKYEIPITTLKLVHDTTNKRK